MHYRSGGTDPGRDGCRVPLPRAAGEPYCGFGSRTEPRFPQPDDWPAYAVDRQAADPDSMLALRREALRLRRPSVGFGDGPLTRLPAPEGVLASARTGGLVCLVNLSAEAVGLPAHRTRLLSSGPLDGEGRLPRDTAVWLRA
jgi:alpha-glucosidase